MDGNATLADLAKDAWKSRAMKAWFFASALLLVADWGLVFSKLLPLRTRGEAVALHYSVLVGIDRLGDWQLTFAPAAFGTVFGAVNVLLALLLWRRRRPLSHMVGIQTVVLETLFLIGTLLLVLLNVGV